MKRFAVFVVFLVLLLLFVCFPHTVSNGAAAGLMLWFKIVIPALLPFLLFAVFFFKLGVTDFVSSLLYPVFHALYGISKNGCYPVLIGFLSGYPLGAKMTADTYKDGRIGHDEAQYILGFCNNASPMFLLEYVGIQCTSSKIPCLFWVCVTLSAFLGARVDLFLMSVKRAVKNKDKQDALFGGTSLQCAELESLTKKNDKNCRAQLKDMADDKKNLNKRSTGIIDVLDESITDCCETLVKIGGYMILFSVLLAVLQQLLPLSGDNGCFLASILEITTGANAMKQCALPLLLRDSVLCGFCAFGGLSSTAQTASVVRGSGLSMVSYLFVKVRQAVLAAVIYYLLRQYF